MVNNQGNGINLFNIENIKKTIIFKLSVVSSYIEFANKISYLDVNKTAEDFFCGLFSIIRDTNYQNLNKKKNNYIAVDLIDEANKITVQITSQNTRNKIDSTKKKFKKTSMFKDGYCLEIFMLTKSKLCKKNKNIKVSSIADLIKEINNKTDNKIYEIADYLDKNISFGISKQIIDETDYNTPKYPQNVKKFFKDCPLTEEDYSRSLSIINKYIDILKNVDKETRQYFCLFLNTMYKHKDNKKIVSQLTTTSTKWLQTSILKNTISFSNERNIYNVISDMEKYGLIVYDKGTEDFNNEEISFKDCSDWEDIAFSLFEFAKKNNIEPRELFVNLDFSYLEE